MTGPFGTKQDLSIRRMITRMFGAAKFNADTFRQLRDDPSANLQSIALVPIIGLCYGVGLSASVFFDTGLSLREATIVILLSLVSAFVIALTWSAITHVIVIRLFKKMISYPSLTRPFLFSWTPGLLFILLSSPNPFVSEACRAIASAWLAIASLFAIRHASGLTIQQSMMTFILSVLILVLALLLVDSVLPLLFT